MQIINDRLLHLSRFKRANCIMSGSLLLLFSFPLFTFGFMQRQQIIRVAQMNRHILFCSHYKFDLDQQLAGISHFS